MKVFSGILIFVVIVFIVWYLCLNHIVYIYEKEAIKYKDKIGTKIILNKDTLLILDYSLLNENFKLSNGQTVSFELVNKLPVIK